MPKAPTATVDEVEAAKTELKTLIAKLNKAKADKEEVQPPATRVQNNVDDLSEIVKQNAKNTDEAVSKARQDGQAYTDTVAEKLRSEVFNALAEEEGARSTGQNQLDAQIQQLDEDVRNAFADELTSLCVKIEEEFASLRQELKDLIDSKTQQVSDHASEIQRQLSSQLTEFRQEAAEKDAEICTLLSKNLQDVVDAEAQVDRDIRATAEKDRKELDAEVARLDALLAELRNTAASDTQASKEEVCQALEGFKNESATRLARMDKRADEHQDFLDMLEQVTARRVEWMLKGASSLIPGSPRSPLGGQEPPDSPSTPSLRHRSYFSPTFSAAGCRGLQLELRVFWRPGRQSTGPDNCSLYLWCPAGVQMHLRFFAGEKWFTVEKGASTDGPAGSKRMGLLQDHINEEDNTLHVGVEILEAIKEVSLQAEPEGHDTVAGQPIADGNFKEPYENSTLSFQRHVNHRVLAQVRKEVDKMQCKMVKRVEWLLSECDQLPRLFPHDQPICSPVFSAGGVDGMQFIFYPMGYRDSTEGFCSLFLYCPAGVNIKCNLNAGSQKRDASNHFRDAGAFGRCNFCRLDSAVDSDTNTALLWLEIEEVIQETKKSMDEEGRKRKPPALELESAAPRAAGSVKLTRIANTDYLTEVRRLPSMWTDQKLGDFVKKPEGFRSFKDFVGKASPKAVSGGGKITEVNAAPGQGPPLMPVQMDSARAASMPALRSERGHDIPLTGPDTLPLLCGPHGEFGSDQGYGSPLLWAGKSRKARSSTSFRQKDLR
mmetsp:Transcript_31249/g.72282  ORF Transcript_31249/g.72282 Transcript_31249/m.72282 type:complete len:772 (-) Transcript_31249:33-2348(-)